VQDARALDKQRHGRYGIGMIEQVAKLQSDLEYIKRDVAELKTDVREVRTEMREVRAEMRDMRGELGNMRGELGNIHGELGDIRREMHGEIRGHWARELVGQGIRLALVHRGG
jgi:chromosome segregation ATPase